MCLFVCVHACPRVHGYVCKCVFDLFCFAFETVVQADIELAMEPIWAWNSFFFCHNLLLAEITEKYY